MGVLARKTQKPILLVLAMLSLLGEHFEFAGTVTSHQSYDFTDFKCFR
jgi:hypothetical protein